MYSTREVRWFLRRAISPAVIGWFESLPGTIYAEDRVDTYLLGLGNDGLGIKIRHQLLEIKLRSRALGPVSLSAHAIGNVEEWRKYSFSLESNDLNLASFTGGGSDWLDVHKRRRMRLFSMGSADTSLPAENTRVLGSGCSVEITELNTRGQDWWSCSFEAFGPTGSLELNLNRAISMVFAQRNPPALRETDSYSYPRWLSGFLKS